MTCVDKNRPRRIPYSIAIASIKKKKRIYMIYRTFDSKEVKRKVEIKKLIRSFSNIIIETYCQWKIVFDVTTRRYVSFGANAATTWRRRPDGSWTQVRRIIPRREYRASPLHSRLSSRREIHVRSMSSRETMTP